MNALAALATNLATAFPVTAANCNEPPFFDFKINDGAYIEITAFNQAARDMLGGRKFIEEVLWHPNITALLDRSDEASFMDADGDTMSGNELKLQLAEMTAANDL